MNGLLLVMVGSGLPAVLPSEAAAQVSVAVELYWTWGDDGWHAHRPVYEPGYAYPPVVEEVVYYVPERSIRIPPGHLPPPGYCRLWYPGTPPGHQPPPRPCHSLFSVRGGGGAVIIGAAGYRDGYGYEERRYDDGYRYDQYRNDGYRYDEYRPTRVRDARVRRAKWKEHPGRGRGRDGRGRGR